MGHGGTPPLDLKEELTMTISEITTKLIGDKRRWNAYKARTRQLPAAYRTTIKALERYLLRFGPADADAAATMFEDLATRFERGAANGTPVRELVGNDPVEFAKTFIKDYPQGGAMDTGEREKLINAMVEDDPAVFEAFLQDYAKGGWAGRERQRLINSVARAEGHDNGKAVAR